jgi:hypothetical protein
MLRGFVLTIYGGPLTLMLTVSLTETGTRWNGHSLKRALAGMLERALAATGIRWNGHSLEHALVGTLTH